MRLAGAGHHEGESELQSLVPAPPLFPVLRRDRGIHLLSAAPTLLASDFEIHVDSDLRLPRALDELAASLRRGEGAFRFRLFPPSSVCPHQALGSAHKDGSANPAR